MKIVKIAAWMIASGLYASSGYGQLPLEYFLPANGPQDQIVRHFAYTLKFNRQYKQADWVIYFLNKGRANGAIPAAEDYRLDPDIKTGQAQDSDYKNSGYEKGHLASSGDMKWSKMAASECCLMSTISPQKAGFRKGPWDALEKQVRIWAEENEDIYVVSGPVLKGNLSVIGPDKVAVPKYFFKVILDYKEPDVKGIGFILPNEPSKKPLQAFAVSIDSVEALTGINFFPNIPDQVESSLEATVDIAKWFGVSAQSDSTGKLSTPMIVKKPAPASTHPVKPGKTFAPAVMCKGITKDGKRCPRMTTNENGYCWEHQDQAKQPSKL
ncbi:MAG: DNA/RNA non-specific endonuclease [Candidatus Latescibacter sp.]|nr:DNA/RNA non-specific endonuclease [Candidatus Latescibacter sp.]